MVGSGGCGYFLSSSSIIVIIRLACTILIVVYFPTPDGTPNVRAEAGEKK